MSLTVLSLAPLPAGIVKLLIQQTPGVPDFEVVEGHEMSIEAVKKAMSEADVVLGDYTFKQKITADICICSTKSEAHPAAPAWATST